MGADRATHAVRDDAAPVPRPWRIIGSVSLAGLLYPLGHAIVLPALPEIAESLDTSPSSITWLVTAPLISAVVLTTTLAKLGDLFGRRRMMLIVIAVFTAGSLLCAVATSPLVVIAGRAAQGASAALFPLAVGLMRAELEPRRVRLGIAIGIAALTVGGGFGPALGGVLAGHLSWRSLFVATAALGVIAGVVLMLSTVPRPVSGSRPRIDAVGAVLLSVTLVAPLLAVSQATSWGWGSPRTLALLAVGATLLPIWVIWERRVEEPLVDVRLMGQRSLLSLNVISALLGAGTFSTVVTVTVSMQQPTSLGGLGLSATAAGLMLLPQGLGVLTPLIMTRVGSRVGPKRWLVLSTSTFGVTTILLVWLHDNLVFVLLTSALFGICFGLAVSALTQLIVAAVPRGQTSVATGLSIVTRGAGAAAGAQLSAAIYASAVVAGTSAIAASGFQRAFVFQAALDAVCLLAALSLPGHLSRRGTGIPSD